MSILAGTVPASLIFTSRLGGIYGGRSRAVPMALRRAVRVLWNSPWAYLFIVGMARPGSVLHVSGGERFEAALPACLLLGGFSDRCTPYRLSVGLARHELHGREGSLWVS